MRKLFKYLTYERERLPRVPRQFVDDYSDTKGATDEQIKLMVRGAARDPREAQRLLDKYNTDYASIVMNLLPKRRVTLRERVYNRIRAMVRRIEGSTRSNPLYWSSRADDNLEFYTRYRREQND